MGDTLKWGIIGAGIIAEQLNDAVRLVDGCEMRAVASKDPDRAAAFAERNGVPTSCTYDEIVADPDIDIIYVATTHNFHRDNVKLALEHGKHVLVEKPFTVSAAEAEELVSLARKANLFLMEAMWTRFLPSRILLRETAASGRIGEVRQVTVHFGNIALPMYYKRLFSPELAGGVTLDMGCYPLSFLSDLLGEIPSEVSSSCRFSESGIDELANYNLKYPSGALAQVCTSFNLLMRNGAMIYGTEGFIEFPNAQSGDSFTIHHHGGTNEIRSSETLKAANADNGFVHQVEEVRRCIADGLTESPGMTLDDSVSLMRIYDGMRRDWGLKYPFES